MYGAVDHRAGLEALRAAERGNRNSPARKDRFGAAADIDIDTVPVNRADDAAKHISRHTARQQTPL